MQVVVIVAIIVFKLSVLTGGTDILLKVAPVDPRDLLRGDYATFEYDISNVDWSYYGNGRQIKIKGGDTVYVTLRQSGKYHVVRAVEKNRPTGGEIFIKGTVDSGGSQIHVIYGIEQYFIPEGTGQNFNFFDKEVAAKVAVDENGNAGLKQIYIDNEPWP